MIRSVRVVAPELMHQLGHDLVFPAARPAEAHGPHVRARGDAGRLPHDIDFDTRLEQAHVVQHVIESDDLQGWMPAVARLGAQAVDPSDHALIEVRVGAHLVEHPRAVLEQPRNNVIQVGDGKRVVCTVVAHRTNRSRALAVPGLPRRIPVAHEQHVVGLFPPRNEDRDRLRLRKAGHVPEVAVLAIGVFDIVVAVAHRSGREDRDGVATHQPHQLATAARELSARYGLHGLHEFRWRGRLQCRAASGGGGWSRSGASSSNISCTPTLTNSTSSA